MKKKKLDLFDRRKINQSVNQPSIHPSIHPSIQPTNHPHDSQSQKAHQTRIQNGRKMQNPKDHVMHIPTGQWSLSRRLASSVRIRKLTTNLLEIGSDRFIRFIEEMPVDLVRIRTDCLGLGEHQGTATGMFQCVPIAFSGLSLVFFFFDPNFQNRYPMHQRGTFLFSMIILLLSYLH